MPVDRRPVAVGAATVAVVNGWRRSLRHCQAAGGGFRRRCAAVRVDRSLLRHGRRGRLGGERRAQPADFGSKHVGGGGGRSGGIRRRRRRRRRRRVIVTGGGGGSSAPVCLGAAVHAEHTEALGRAVEPPHIADARGAFARRAATLAAGAEPAEEARFTKQVPAL